MQDSGHEVLVWPQDETVMSLVSNTGPHGRTLQRSVDAVRFQVIGRLPANFPRAPGLFRADMSERPHDKSKSLWGVAMATYRGDPYLTRYNVTLKKVD